MVAVGTGKERDHGECPEVHEHVDEEVVEDRGQPVLAARDDSDQDVPRLRNAGVGEKPFEAGLHDRHQVAEDHAREGDDREQHLPLRREVRQAAGEDADDHGDRRRLGPHRHERGDRDRGPLVHVGRPHVERRSRDLEGEADAHQDDAQQDQRVGAGRVAEALRDVGDHGRPRAAVDERHPVKHERAREPADQQVLGSRLLGAEVGAGESAHYVERDREKLQAQEDGDERCGRGEDHHPDHRGHGQDVKLRLEQAAPPQVGVGQGHRQDAEAGEEDLEEKREVVARREAVVRVVAGREQPSVDGHPKRIREADHGEHGDHPAAA